MRQGAARDVEQARASADREVTEARRVLAVEKERLAREAADHHEAATQQTAKLVADAEARASAADDRAREAMNQATAARESAGDEAARIIEGSRAEAASIVAAARADADNVAAAAATDLERQTRRLRNEVEDLQARRESILVQMGQIRDIVAGIAPADVVAAEEAAGADELEESGPDGDTDEDTPEAKPTFRLPGSDESAAS
jgi:hypothetical protein